MRSVTQPLFPAQAGAVTLQEVIDAREGDRLPLELALYVSGEVGRQVTQLQALGRQGALDPKRVWCTSKGAVVVHEAHGTSSPHALSDLVYRLLSGSGDVSAWPPSYFNPSVAESIDAAVMSAVSGEKPEDPRALVDVVSAAASTLDPEAFADGMARLVFAVEPKAPGEAPKAAPLPPEPVSEVSVPVPKQRTRAIAAGTAALVLLVAIVCAAALGGSAPAVAVPAAIEGKKALTGQELKQKTVEAYRATRPVKTAAAPKRPAAAKRK